MSQAGIVDIESSNPQVPTSFTTDSGNAIPIANNLEILGDTVANGLFAEPVWTTASGKTVEVNVQVGTAIAAAPADKFDAGLASFDSASFAVDTNGYVTLIGGGPTIDSVGVDANTAPGTDPVLPNGSGMITVTGAQVAAGTTTNVVRTNSVAANEYTIEIQRSSQQAVSTIGANGVCHFFTSDFTVAGTGFVTLSTTGAGKTITGDTGGALSPTANNWNILGGPGVTVTGSGSTLTVNSVTYTDQPIQVTAASDSGSFMTNAGNIILDLPAVPAQGELIEIVCTTAFLVAVDVPAGDFIRIGTLITSSGGTATSTSIGDSLKLRFCFSTQTWYAISVVGTWSMA